MVFLLAALALLQPQDDDRRSYSSSEYALVYLARHQRRDGSWGAASGACACPFERRPLDANQKRCLAKHLACLEDDDLEVRDGAQRALWSLGPGVIPDVQEASLSGDVEKRSRCLEMLRERHRFQAPGDRKTTALAVLSFLWQGQTAQSRDIYRRTAIGPVVRKGLERLCDSGQPPSDPVAEALAALALSEAAALTETSVLQDAARLAFERLPAVTCEETEFLAWKTLLLKSATRSWRKNEVTSEFARIRASVGGRLDPLSRCTAYLCDLWSGAVPDAWDAAGALAVSPLDLDPPSLFFATLVYQQLFGRRELVNSWFETDIRREILAPQRTRREPCEEGAWMCSTPAATIRKTALLSMSLGIYYRYVASPGNWDAVRPEEE